MKKQLLATLLCLSSLLAFSQIKGTVTDSKKNPIPFVNIFIENTYVGTTSNENGNYELNITAPKDYTIVYQFLGFKTIKKKISITQFPHTLDVVMEDEEISLNEVVVTAGENPANKIMRAAIAKREENFDKIKAYKANYYSRGLIKIKDAPEKIFGVELGDLGGSIDSTRSGIIYLSETISEIEFLKPDKLKEKIVASKVSGDNNGFSFNTAGDADFNFYNNTIPLGNQIISPLADYAFNYYTYKLEGIFYDDKGNLINKVNVIPKRKNDRIFSGSIYIVEDQWTIYATELSITGEQAQIPAADKITITQHFSYSENDNIWALISQTMDFEYAFLGLKGDGRFIAVYSDYIFNPELTKSDFGREILSFQDQANKKDSTYWATLRPVPLTVEEVNDYVKKDSIQIVRESKPYLDSIDGVNNKFKFGDLISGYNYSNSYKKYSLGVSSPLSGFNFNTVQGYNSKVKLYYTQGWNDYSQYLSTAASFNYGVSDDRLRATVSASYKFNNTTRPYLSASGGVTVQQFNDAEPISKLENTISSLFFMDNYMKLYDKTFAKISYSQEVTNGFRAYGNVSYERRKALFNTTDQTFFKDSDDAYTSNNPLNETAFGIPSFDTHHIAKLELNTAITFGQEYFSYPDRKINLYSSKYPKLYLGYEKGFAASDSKYNFDQIKARITQQFDIGDKGTFIYNLRAGMFFNADDIAFMDYKHFNANQTHFSSHGNYTNVFNNLPYYEHSTNTSYLEAHAEHDFNGFILQKIPLLNKLNFNLILGAHALAIDGKTPYQEYTVGIDNIGWGKYRFLRIDYLRSYQSGFVSDAVVFGLKFN